MVQLEGITSHLMSCNTTTRSIYLSRWKSLMDTMMHVDNGRIFRFNFEGINELDDFKEKDKLRKIDKNIKEFILHPKPLLRELKLNLDLMNLLLVINLL